MSRTRHRSKAPGCDFWKSRLHPGGETPSTSLKRHTRRVERARARRYLRKRPEDADRLRW